MWWPLEGVLAALFQHGFQVRQINQGGLSLIKNRTVVTLPIGKGDWLPDLFIRHTLRHTHLNLDALADDITMPMRPL